MERGLAAGLAAAVAALAAAACAHREPDALNCADFVMSPVQYTAQIRGRLGAMENEELAFVCRAAAYGRAQMIYAHMAARQATAARVRRFAAEILNTQETLTRRLEQVAVQHEGITPPPGLEPAQIAERAELAQLSGAGFDRAYLRHVVEDGRAALELFRQGSALPEPLMSEFAGQALPTLEQRVSAAQGLLRETGS